MNRKKQFKWLKNIVSRFPRKNSSIYATSELPRFLFIGPLFSFLCCFQFQICLCSSPIQPFFCSSYLLATYSTFRMSSLVFPALSFYLYSVRVIRTGLLKSHSSRSHIRYNWRPSLHGPYVRHLPLWFRFSSPSP